MLKPLPTFQIPEELAETATPTDITESESPLPKEAGRFAAVRPPGTQASCKDFETEEELQSPLPGDAGRQRDSGTHSDPA